MPMYSYTCLACDEEFDRIVKINDRDRQTCTKCGNFLHRGIDRPGWVWAPTSGKG